MAADGVGMGPHGRVAWLEVRIEWTHQLYDGSDAQTIAARDVPLHVSRSITKNEAIIPPASTGLVGV